MSQQGDGATPGYDAISVRRMFDGIASEGVLSSGSYAVTQRGAGANMTVDIAASTGEGARIQGDAVTHQGTYRISPHNAVINEAISAAHATLPRNDLVVLELRDNVHDASGSSLAQTRVIAGTATAGAAKTDAFGVNGTPTLPASAIPLAIVNVPATDTSIDTTQIDDRRPFVWSGGSGGKSIIATAESRTNTAYGTLTTPDVVKGIVLPTDGLIAVAYSAMWQESVANAARAAIFLGTNQTRIQAAEYGLPAAVAARTGEAASTAAYRALSSGPGGLLGLDGITIGDPVTTGMIVGHMSRPSASESSHAEVETTSAGTFVDVDLGGAVGGPCYIYAAAGTYDVSVQFRSTSGSVTAKNRKLWVWTIGFG